MGVNRQFPQGVRGHDLHLMADNGCQPTAISFMKTTADIGIKQAFTSYNNPKGNADTERFMRTLKEELVWINEWSLLRGSGRVDWLLQQHISALNTGLHAARKVRRTI